MTGMPVLRHLDDGPAARVDDVGAAGLQAMLDGGDLDDWRPVLSALAHDPWGPVAARPGPRSGQPDRTRGGEASRRERVDVPDRW